MRTRRRRTQQPTGVRLLLQAPPHAARGIHAVAQKGQIPEEVIGDRVQRGPALQVLHGPTFQSRKISAGESGMLCQEKKQNSVPKGRAKHPQRKCGQDVGCATSREDGGRHTETKQKLNTRTTRTAQRCVCCVMGCVGVRSQQAREVQREEGA